jgi:asparagine synthase (glutamine-hydrolysing)
MVGQKKIRLASDEAYQKRLRELIEDAIKRRVDAVSGMVGAELSGGLD